jgi:hypothetical protein
MPQDPSFNLDVSRTVDLAVVLRRPYTASHRTFFSLRPPGIGFRLTMVALSGSYAAYQGRSDETYSVNDSVIPVRYHFRQCHGHDSE